MMEMMILWSSREAIWPETDGKRRRRSEADARHDERRPQVHLTHLAPNHDAIGICLSSLLICSGAGVKRSSAAVPHVKITWNVQAYRSPHRFILPRIIPPIRCVRENAGKEIRGTTAK